MQYNMSVIWICIVIFLAVVEIATTQLVSIWFVIAGIVTFAISFFCDSVIIQVILFIGLTLMLLALTRPMVKKFMNFKKEDTNLGRNIGKKAIVIQEIDNDLGTGQVKLSGVIWAAKTDDGTVIPNGDLVQVEKIEGAKLIVKKIK